jgi:hypothetical protein
MSVERFSFGVSVLFSLWLSLLPSLVLRMTLAGFVILNEAKDLLFKVNPERPRYRYRS